MSQKEYFHLYRFNCGGIREAYGAEDLEELDYCDTCEDKICFFVSTLENWHIDLCKLITTKFQDPGKYDCEWGDGARHRLPRSFLCLSCFYRYPGDEDYQPLLKALIGSEELRGYLEKCVVDVGAILAEEIEALKRRKLYLHIKDPPKDSFRVL